MIAKDKGSSQCSKCEEGTTTKGEEGKEECEGKCDAGTYKTANDLNCVKCTAGKYSDPGQGECKKCEKGYTSKNGEEKCSKCRTGRYTDVEGKAYRMRVDNISTYLH